MHVIDVVHDADRLVVTVESDQDVGGCPACGVVAVGHGRRVHELADAPCFRTPVRLRWVKRIWRCREPTCPVRTCSETHDLAPPRAKLTARAVAWATDALAHDDTTASALARHLGVDWHTCWDAVEIEAARRISDPARLTVLRRGREHLTDRHMHRLNTGLAVGDPFFEVTVAWHCYQQLRSMYQASSPADGRRIAEQVIGSFPTCPVTEIARLGRTLRQWRSHVLARFDTHHISNGGTEAVNLLIEKTRRLAHGSRTFDHYRLRVLLAASGQRPYRCPTHA
jgi:transposase